MTAGPAAAGTGDLVGRHLGARRRRAHDRRAGLVHHRSGGHLHHLQMRLPPAAPPTEDHRQQPVQSLANFLLDRRRRFFLLRQALFDRPLLADLRVDLDELPAQSPPATEGGDLALGLASARFGGKQLKTVLPLRLKVYRKFGPWPGSPSRWRRQRGLPQRPLAAVIQPGWALPRTRISSSRASCRRSKPSSDAVAGFLRPSCARASHTPDLAPQKSSSALALNVVHPPESVIVRRVCVRIVVSVPTP